MGTCTERTPTASRREVVGAASGREVLGMGKPHYALLLKLAASRRDRAVVDEKRHR
ncbi:MAG: hypothetical protein V7K14_18295 [Nostoc sp.]|uniref:hypothetical protein n=1 Tax=Nostoc sp. TaxID=1180 RepID=UPI002FFA61E4